MLERLLRKLRPTALPLLLGLLLGGCYISHKPLVRADEGDFPVRSFTYRGTGADADSSYTFVHKGSAYVPEPPAKDEKVELLFKKLPSGHYLLQLKGGKPKQPVYVYTVLSIDFAKGTADLYKAVGRDQDVGPGLRDCPEQAICVENLAAYVALGEAAIAAGGKPDASYTFSVQH